MNCASLAGCWISCGVSLACGAALGLVSGKTLLSAPVTSPSIYTDKGRITGAWPYTMAADGGFAAFTAGGGAVVESRWQGPHFLSLKPDGVALPLRTPWKSPCKYAFGGAISPNRVLFATTVRGRRLGRWRVCVWDVARRLNTPTVVPGHSNGTADGLAFSPDSREIASVDYQAHRWVIAIHDAVDGKTDCILRFPQRVNIAGNSAQIRFLAQNRVVSAVGNGTGSITCWAVHSGRVLYSKRIPKVAALSTDALCVSAHRLLVAGPSLGDRTKQLVISLDPATGKATGFLNVNKSGKGSPVAKWYDISHICVSPDGRYALVTESGFRGRTHGMGDVGRIVVVDLARMKVVYRSVVLPDLWCVDVAPDGKRALLAGSTRVYIWHPPFKL